MLLYCWHSVPVVQVRASSPSSSRGLCTCCSPRPQRCSSRRHPPRVPAQTPARPRPTRQTGPGPSVLHPLFCLCGISQNTHYWSRCLIPFSSEGRGRVCLVPTKPQHLGRNLEVPEGVRDSTVSHQNEPDHLPHGSGEREGPSSSRHRRVLLLGLPPLLEEAAEPSGGLPISEVLPGPLPGATWPPFSLHLADTTSRWRSRDDLSSDNAKAAALPSGCTLGRRDLHSLVPAAASCALCGCPCVAFSSERVTLNWPSPRRERDAEFGILRVVPTMHLARRSPGTRLPAPPNPFIVPRRPLGSKFLTLSWKAKTPFENTRRGRWTPLSFSFLFLVELR